MEMSAQVGDAVGKNMSEPFEPPRAVSSTSVDAASDEVRLVLDRLLSEAEGIADRLAVRPPEIEARERELDELEDLRTGLMERTEAANERFGAAERIVEQSRARLAEIADMQHSAKETLEVAMARAEAIVAEAEAKAAALQAQAERNAVARIRRSEREAADRLLDADTEARRMIAEAVSVLRDSEAKAEETVATVQERVDEVVSDATRARHADIDELHAREREIENRIRDLVADSAALASLPRAEPLRGASGGPERESLHSDVAAESLSSSTESTIDLTDVSSAISDAIDEWVHRRDAR